MFVNDKKIITKDKDGKEIEIEVPETPQPQILMEYTQPWQRRTFSTDGKDEVNPKKKDGNI